MNNKIGRVIVSIHDPENEKAGNLVLLNDSLGLLAVQPRGTDFFKTGWPFIINNDTEHIHFFKKSLGLKEHCVIVLDFADYSLKDGDVIYPLNQYCNKVTNEEIYKEACNGSN